MLESVFGVVRSVFVTFYFHGCSFRPTSRWAQVRHPMSRVFCSTAFTHDMEIVSAGVDWWTSSESPSSVGGVWKVDVETSVFHACMLVDCIFSYSLRSYTFPFFRNWALLIGHNKSKTVTLDYDSPLGRFLWVCWDYWPSYSRIRNVVYGPRDFSDFVV